MHPESPGVVGLLATEPLVTLLVGRVRALGFDLAPISDSGGAGTGQSRSARSPLDVALIQPRHPMAESLIPVLVASAVPIILLSEPPRVAAASPVAPAATPRAGLPPAPPEGAPGSTGLVPGAPRAGHPSPGAPSDVSLPPSTPGSPAGRASSSTPTAPPGGSPREGVLGYLDPADAAGPALLWAIRHAVAVGRAARDENSRRLLLAGQVAATVGHELNNALTYVMANLEYASAAIEVSKPRNDGLLDTLIEARQGVRRLAAVVGELSKVARSPSAKVGPVYVGALVNSALDMAHERLRDRARVRTDLRVRHAVAANEAKLFQVLLNLIINAALAIEPGNPEKHEVVVSSRWEGRQVCLEVSDTGVGIPPENIHRIFEHFFTTRASGAGSGIGLALCRRYVEEMGGELTVESVVGRGTTMRLLLNAARSAASRPTLVPDLGSVRARVLVVDDEVLIGRAIQRALRADHDVVAVASLGEALAALEGERFDLIFTDVWLGTESGVDLYHAVVARYPDMRHRIAFITGGPTDVDTSLLEPIDVPRFRKPLTVDELRDAVESILSR